MCDEMRHFKLTLAYDGTDFHGWQVQPGAETVQGRMREAIRLITGAEILPQGSGRTDAGVHALGQVASFSAATNIPVANLRAALNSRLPASIRIHAVEEVGPEFHARHSAHEKTYQYRLYRGEVTPPFFARYVTRHPWPLDEDAMRRAAGYVVGRHDFTSFAANDPDRAARLADADDPADNVREIYESRFDREGEELVYTVRGAGFLHHMVRNLVGTFLLAGKGRIAPEGVQEIMAARDRARAGATAPASGLWLISVRY